MKGPSGCGSKPAGYLFEDDPSKELSILKAKMGCSPGYLRGFDPLPSLLGLRDCRSSHHVVSPVFFFAIVLTRNATRSACFLAWLSPPKKPNRQGDLGRPPGILSSFG